MKTKLVQISLLCLSLFVASCGGGGGGAEQSETTTPPGSETGNWNDMRWDEANWQ